MVYQVALHHYPDGTLLAECPELPGCSARGRNEQEALANVREAITAWMWDARRHASDFQLPLAG